MKKLPKINLV
jgi:hypothetical protein